MTEQSKLPTTDTNPKTGWESYFDFAQKRVKRITLDAFKLPQFWVDIRYPGSMSPREIKDMLVKERTKLEEALHETIKAGGDISELNIGTFITQSEMGYIVAWNVTHPKTGDMLKPPAEDPNVLQYLPTDVLMHLKAVILEMTEEMVPPKLREMLSMIGRRE